MLEVNQPFLSYRCQGEHTVFAVKPTDQNNQRGIMASRPVASHPLDPNPDALLA